MLHGLAAYTLLHHVKNPVLGTLLLSLTWLALCYELYTRPRGLALDPGVF